MKRWYVVQTKATAETKAVFNLKRQGYETYLPVYRKTRRHARKTTKILAPLFPRYLFVCLDVASQSWRSIRSTIGVSNLVCNGDAPAPLPVGLIDSIRMREGQDGLIAMDLPSSLQKGASLRIDTGPFADQVGLFDRVSADRRVIVLLNLLGRQMEVVLPFDAVVPTT